MALDPARLATAIRTRLEANDPEGFGAASAELKDGITAKLFTSIAEALVTELTTNARATGIDDPTGDTHSLAIE